MKKVCIIGLGLIGASLGKSLKTCPNKYHISGIVRNKNTAKEVLKAGAADAVYLDYRKISDSDIVVIALPIDKTAQIYKEIAPFLKSGAIVSDTGSIKGAVEKEIASFIKTNKSAPDFVGAHPMTGKEKNGLFYSEADLFKGANTVITGSIKKLSENEAKIAQMWRDTGAAIIKMPSKKHDELVSFTSHLPHLIAFALNKIYKDKKKKAPAIESIAAGSFYSAIRVASSSADMWAPIFVSNSVNTKKNLQNFIRHLNLFAASFKDKEKIKKKILESQET